MKGNVILSKKKFCPQSGQDLKKILAGPEKKLSPGHFGGKFFFLLKITFPFISGDFRAKKNFDPRKFF